MYKLAKNISQISCISNIAIEFKILMAEACHKYHLYNIVDEFKIVVLEVDHKFHIYDIIDD
jgi:hypothetical protein